METKEEFQFSGRFLVCKIDSRIEVEHDRRSVRITYRVLYVAVSSALDE